MVNRRIVEFLGFPFIQSIKDVTYQMAEIHIFPLLEPELHIESAKCECTPVKQEDEKTGDTTWIHMRIKLDQLIDQLEMY
ncbi:MAG TPA: hypothetical protein VM101_05230 [Flavitalea sp.]|nr:hypothetical protein [Flavitalea sp.]